jgi:flagellar hook-associated protein 3 FlgL
MRISTSHIFNQNLSAMLTQQTEMGRTQLQVSTGKKILNPSDDPAASVQILNLQREINLTDQYQANADKAENKLSIEEGTLKSATELVQRIRELAIQGLNDSNTQNDRTTLAAEISQLNEQLLTLANTRDSNGDYIFSGFSNDIQPYSTVGASYAGDGGQRNIQVGPGVLIATNDAGNEIFESRHVQTAVTDNNAGPPSSGVLNIISVGSDHVIPSAIDIDFSTGPDTLTVTMGGTPYAVTPYVAGQQVSLKQLDPSLPDFTISMDGTLANGDSHQMNTQVTPNKTIFSTINDFVTALSSDAVSANDSPNDGDFLINITASLETIVNTQAEIGSRLNAVDQQREVSSGISFAVEKTLSQLKDLDYASAISKLSLQTLGLQAAQQSFSRVQNLSLFNFL